jgi:hypothetical protein
MDLRTTTNHENRTEIDVPLRLRHVDEGRFILARSEPEYEYDLDDGNSLARHFHHCVSASVLERNPNH